MKIKHAVLVFLISAICIPLSYGQGTILMLNGKEKRYMTYQMQDEYLLFQPESKPDSWKKRLDRFNVFSITPDNGTEIVVYDPDTTDGLEANVEEARQFIAGEKMAIKTYKNPMVFIRSTQIGLCASLLQFYGIPAPLVFATVVGRVTPKMPESLNKTTYSDSFVLGYEKKARIIKINRALLGGGIGFAVGFAALAVFLVD